MAGGSKNNADNSIAGLAQLHEAALADVTLIQNADNMVDTKASQIMAANLIILVLVLGRALDIKQVNNIFLWLSAACLLLSVVIVLWLISIKDYYGNVPELKENDELLSEKPHKLLIDLIRLSEYSATQNVEALLRKKEKYRWLLIFFLAGTILGIISLLVAITITPSFDIIRLI
jgi:hypothetical protein